MDIKNKIYFLYICTFLLSGLFRLSFCNLVYTLLHVIQPKKDKKEKETGTDCILLRAFVRNIV